MAYERIYLDGSEYVREEDGQEIERRPATNVELTKPLPLDPDPADINAATIRVQAINAAEANRAFLNVASPTNAQNAAQIKALTRQMNGLIRLVLNQFDATD